MPGDATPIDERGATTTGGRRATDAAMTARRPPTTYAVGGLLIVGALLAGCGGGSPSGSVASLGSHTSSSRTQTGVTPAREGHESSPGSQALAYTACMHSHGVPNFPEPRVSEHGSEVSVRMAVPVGVGSNPKFKPAQQACRKLLPGGGPHNERALTLAEQEQYLRAAACIRSHGVPNFPDPTFSDGQAHIEHNKLDENSPAFKTAVRDCESLIPGGARGGGSGHAQQAAPAPGR